MRRLFRSVASYLVAAPINKTRRGAIAATGQQPYGFRRKETGPVTSRPEDVLCVGTHEFTKGDKSGRQCRFNGYWAA